ncbi:tetratricopeptide repeat protein [Nocardia sp. NPDC003963]
MSTGEFTVRAGDRHGTVEDETWFRRAAEAGVAEAMNHLAVLLQRRGEAAAAETWYRRAVAAGHHPAMYHLADVLEARGETAEAEAWFRRSVREGDHHAMYAVARLLHKRGRAAEAEIWLGRAVAGLRPGDPCSGNSTIGGRARKARTRAETRDSSCCPRV